MTINDCISAVLADPNAMWALYRQMPRVARPWAAVRTEFNDPERTIARRFINHKPGDPYAATVKQSPTRTEGYCANGHSAWGLNAKFCAECGQPIFDVVKPGCFTPFTKGWEQGPSFATEEEAAAWADDQLRAAGILLATKDTP